MIGDLSRDIAASNVTERRLLKRALITFQTRTPSFEDWISNPQDYRFSNLLFTIKYSPHTYGAKRDNPFMITGDLISPNNEGKVSLRFSDYNMLMRMCAENPWLDFAVKYCDVTEDWLEICKNNIHMTIQLPFDTKRYLNDRNAKTLTFDEAEEFEKVKSADFDDREHKRKSVEMIQQRIRKKKEAASKK